MKCKGCGEKGKRTQIICRELNDDFETVICEKCLSEFKKARYTPCISVYESEKIKCKLLKLLIEKVTK